MNAYITRSCTFLLAMAFLFLAGCSGESPVAPEDPPEANFPDPETLTAVPSDQLLKDVVDENCASPFDADPAKLLYNIPLSNAMQGACTPKGALTAPDAHQLTAQEWTQAKGEVTITCVQNATNYAFSFQGLVPNGLYTIWHFPGSGGGALASHPGDTRNAFRATGTGTARFSATGTAGAMTFGGTVPACTLPVPSQSEVGDLGGELFVVVYHKDNKDWGDFPGPEDLYAGHLIFLGR